MRGLADLHCHCLPGIDDGARDAALGGAMLRGLAALGFDLVCPTPHQKARAFMPSPEAIAAARRAVDEAARAAGIELRVGAENFYDEVFLERLGAGTVPGYEGSRAFLVEVSTDVFPPGIEARLFASRARGALPVLAHPERYQALRKSPERLEAVARTAAFVVDLAALDGAHGRDRMKFARELVEQGRVQALASDVHSPEDLRAVGAGIGWLRKRVGDAGADRLLRENPRRILAGELPT